MPRKTKPQEYLITVHTPLQYTAAFGVNPGNYFNEFEKQLKTGELQAYKDLPDGRLAYRYSDGAVLLNGKGVENRRGAMLELFNLGGEGSKEVIASYSRRRRRRRGWWYSAGIPKYKEVKITSAVCHGTVCKFRNRWLEIVRIMDEKGGRLTRNNGLPFTDDIPRSNMAKPGYEPMMRFNIGVRTTGPSCSIITKSSVMEGIGEIWVRPSDMRVFIESMKPIKRTGKLRRHQNWRRYSEMFRVVRIKGITEPAGAIGAAQFTKLILGI